MREFFYLLLFLSISCSSNSNNDVKNIPDKKNGSVIKHQEPKIISDSTNILENRVQQLELEYILWGCACANWITSKDMIKYQDSGLAKHCIFIEPADSTLTIPDSFQPGSNKIIVKGQFYIREDYPQGTIQTEENLEKAKVFRYTSLKIISNPGDVIEKGSQKLQLEYILWRCACPNWITTSDRLRYQKIGDIDKYCFYIEPSTNKQILPDSFDLSKHDIIVTGKFISSSGYPKGYDLTKEDARPAKVFRYTSFKIIAKKNAPY